MAYAARTLGLFFQKASLSSGIFSLSSIQKPYTMRSFLRGISPSRFSPMVGGAQRKRRIWTTSPVCMGSRSCKIAGRKDAQNLKKMKRNSRIGKEIVSAIKKGGPNPSSNTVLAAVLEKARELEVPKEIVERNVKKASDKSQEAFIEKFYEVYGFGGVGMVVEVLTDKITRSVADVRGVVKDSGAKLADPGSILFKFRRVRVVNVKAINEKDQVLAIALDAGAEDVIEPNLGEEDDSEDNSERSTKTQLSHTLAKHKFIYMISFNPTLWGRLTKHNLHKLCVYLLNSAQNQIKYSLKSQSNEFGCMNPGFPMSSLVKSNTRASQEVTHPIMGRNELMGNLDWAKYTSGQTQFNSQV